MAQILNEQFSSVFTRQDADKLPSVDTRFKNWDSRLSRWMIVRPSLIANHIDGMKLNKPPGVDGIPSAF